MRLTTLCYLKQNGKYLMLYRCKKEKDVNKGKWIGIGGGFLEGESPEDCLLRAVWEETDLTLTSWKFRGIVTFSSDGWETEYMHLFTADGFSGELAESCDEGELAWIPEDKLADLPMWEGDRIFFDLIANGEPFFSLKLSYKSDKLVQAALNGIPLELNQRRGAK